MATKLGIRFLEATSGVGLFVAPKVAQECWRLCSQSGDVDALRRLLTAYSALTHGRPSPLFHARLRQLDTVRESCQYGVP